MTRAKIEGDVVLDRVGARLKAAGDKDLKRATSAAIRKVAKPIGERVLRSGAARLPRAGGLSARVSTRGKVGVRAALTGRSASVTLALKADGYDLRPIEQRGELRHPVFGRPVWVRQRVEAGAFGRAFAREAPGPVRDAVAHAAQGVMDDVARGL